VALGATGDFVTTDFGQFLGPAANGLIMTDTGHWKCAAKRKAGAAYIAYFKKTLGRYPDSNELVGADAVGAVAAAIRKAGSTDGQKLVDALHRMSYNGLRFAAQWDSKGNLKHTPIPIVVWAKDGAQLNDVLCDVQPVVRLKKGK
jgi:branched-chain amino acid transport system substrate-binding protein